MMLRRLVLSDVSARSNGVLSGRRGLLSSSQLFERVKEGGSGDKVVDTSAVQDQIKEVAGKKLKDDSGGVAAKSEREKSGSGVGDEANGGPTGKRQKTAGAGKPGMTEAAEKEEKAGTDGTEAGKDPQEIALEDVRIAIEKKLEPLPSSKFQRSGRFVCVENVSRFASREDLRYFFKPHRIGNEFFRRWKDEGSGTSTWFVRLSDENAAKEFVKNTKSAYIGYNKVRLTQTDEGTVNKELGNMFIERKSLGRVVAIKNIPQSIQSSHLEAFFEGYNLKSVKKSSRMDPSTLFATFENIEDAQRAARELDKGLVMDRQITIRIL
eukprot:CAMPEP_0184741064 /NCGR_PEP_ID=MMETSP0315-20130426/4154_1 /TAXON_ID=101924 /ORGANISM="Rhodosorus marinus, Strain UTEX LB 2760" /LENGTH=322 /DNA_ID=CAMNT_0027211195 /DNA_START=166 /DNA_END=1134 /DNA_ORIENTATION=+